MPQLDRQQRREQQQQQEQIAVLARWWSWASICRARRRTASRSRLAADCTYPELAKPGSTTSRRSVSSRNAGLMPVSLAIAGIGETRSNHRIRGIVSVGCSVVGFFSPGHTSSR